MSRLLLVLVLLGLLVPATAEGRRNHPAKVVPGDATLAVILACHAENVSSGACQSFLTVAWCESRMNRLATNGQYKGLFQLSSRHRSDPLIVALGWRDAYAQALHTVRYVIRHGWGEWQCMPGGGLRW